MRMEGVLLLDGQLSLVREASGSSHVDEKGRSKVVTAGKLLMNDPLSTNQALCSLAHSLGDELLEIVEEPVGDHCSHVDALFLVLRSCMSKHVSYSKIADAGSHVGDEG